MQDPSSQIDWNDFMRNVAPPEWDLLLSLAAKNDLEQARSWVKKLDVPVSYQWHWTDCLTRNCLVMTHQCHPVFD